jgi:hypothetical protein
VLLGAGLDHACDGLKLRGDTSYIARGEDSENDGNRSVCQSLVLTGYGGVSSPEACLGFRVILVGAQNTLTRERLDIALDPLVSEPLLQGWHTKEVGSDKRMTDVVEEVMPPRLIDVPSTQSVKRCVYTVLQDVSVNTERHLPCLPLLVHTT